MVLARVSDSFNRYFCVISVRETAYYFMALLYSAILAQVIANIGLSSNMDFIAIELIVHRVS